MFVYEPGLRRVQGTKNETSRCGFLGGQIAAHNLSNMFLFFSALADASGEIFQEIKP